MSSLKAESKTILTNGDPGHIDNLPEQSPEETLRSEETLLQELLKAAQDTSSLNGLTLQRRIEKILDLRIKNELMINQLLNVGVCYDKIDVQDAAAINNKSKDSISELIKIYRLLQDLSTENINLYTLEEKEELERLRGGLN